MAAMGQRCNDAECHAVTVADARLQRLLETWETLSEEIKQVIDALTS
jgi:hypothetical protein